MRSLLGTAVLTGLAGAAPRDMMSAIPMHFEPNLGQTDARVRFSARGAGMSIYLTAEETVIARKSSEPVRMKLRGGRAAKFEPLERLPGVSNYYHGNDPKKWREGVPHFARVRARSVYEGVDVVYYGNGRKLEYDFLVAPHADPSKIELAYEGIERMRVDKDGALVLVTASGELRQRKPLVYQEVEGRRVEVAAMYRIEGQAVRFELARYDAEAPLVIDPILDLYTSLDGDNFDWAYGLSVESTGIWVTGFTSSPNFPLASPVDSTVAGRDGFVTRLNAAGTAIVFSTFLGGSGDDHLVAMSIDTAGNAFAVGSTESPDFPVAAAYQSTYGGLGDGVAVRLGPAGALNFATYVGGSTTDGCGAAVLTSAGISFACVTASPNFPGMTGPAYVGAVLVRLSLNGANLLFSRVLPGAAHFSSLAADSSGAVYIAGSTFSNASLPTTPGAFQPPKPTPDADAFIAKLNPAGDQWVYLTHLGGTGTDRGTAIAVDATGQAWVTGDTSSSDFPTRNAHQPSLASQCCSEDTFLTVLNAAGTALVFSTYLGGSDTDNARSLALLSNGGAVIGGTTVSPDFPIVAGWRSVKSYSPGIFFAKFTSTGALTYSSYFESNDRIGSLHALAPGAAGSVYLAGAIFTSVATSGSYAVPAATQAFVARFSDGPAPVQITVTSNPMGRQMIVDGVRVTTPASLSWQPDTPHRLDPNTPHVDAHTVFNFANWAHGGPPIQTLTAPTAATTYTANYSTTPCGYAFAPSTIAVGFERNVPGVPFAANSACKWTPRSSAPWLIVDSLQEVTGSAMVYLTVEANLGGPRSATVAAGTATLTVNQAGGQAGYTAPTFTAPLDNQTLDAKGINVAWNAMAGAAGYEVRVYERYCCSGSQLGTLVHMGRQTGGNTTRTALDLPDGSYRALVRACGPGGFGDANCGIQGALSFSVSLLAPLFGPAVLTPADNQILRTSTNPINWHQLSGARSYEVTLYNIPAGRQELVINTATLGTVFTMKSSTQYRLAVRGCDMKCGPATWVDFSVQLPTLAQTPPTGLSAQIANGNTLNLSWNAVTGADLYRIQVVQAGAGPGGGALTVAARQVSATNASMPVPAGAATVVLNACNGDGCGPASTVAINPSGPNPSAPVVASPMPVVVADGPIVTVSWSRIPGDNGSNTDYRLYVGDLSRDGPALDVVTKNNFYGAYLRAEGRRYDALVFATQNGTTVTGPASGFMVAGASATASLITAPTHNSTFRQGAFRLAWAPIPDAVRYQYYVVREGGQSPDLTGMTPGLFVDTSLLVTANTVYNAIVRACPSNNASQCSPDSDAGWGPWSNTVTGTTRFTVAP